MANEPRQEPLIDRVVGSVLGTMALVLQRLVVNAVALAAAVFLIDSLFGTFLFGEMGLKISIYAGIICLVPYGSFSNPFWWIPVLTGCLQALVLLVLGIPWPLVLFWAGLQTWTLRLVIARGNAGWDWTACPVLIIGLYAYFSRASLWGLPMLPLASFPCLVAAGFVAYKFYIGANHKAVHRQLLASLLVRLRKLVQSKKLVTNEDRYCTLLLSQCETLAVSNALPDELIDRVQTVVSRLEDLVQKRAARPLGGLFKSAQWQHLGSRPQETGQTRDVVEELQELVTILGQLVQQLRTPEPDPATSRDEARFLELSAQAQSLLEKLRGLPPELAQIIERIAFLTLDMVKCMREDVSDRRQGQSFLGRYLPKVHSVVDEYRRLGQQVDLQRTREVLERVAQAFAEEKERMQRNDNINYTAEIDALDTLLKMRGY